MLGQNKKKNGISPNALAVILWKKKLKIDFLCGCQEYGKKFSVCEIESK